MANTLRITSLPNGSLRVRVQSAGERDMSADVTPDELMVAYDKALNDQNRGVHEDQELPVEADPELPVVEDTPPKAEAPKKTK